MPYRPTIAISSAQDKAGRGRILVQPKDTFSGVFRRKRIIREANGERARANSFESSYQALDAYLVRLAIGQLQVPPKVRLSSRRPFEGNAGRQIFKQSETLSGKVPDDSGNCRHQRMPQQVHRDASLRRVVSPIPSVRAYQQHSVDECPISRETSHESPHAVTNNYARGSWKTFTEPIYCSRAILTAPFFH